MFCAYVFCCCDCTYDTDEEFKKNSKASITNIFMEKKLDQDIGNDFNFLSKAQNRRHFLKKCRQFIEGCDKQLDDYQRIISILIKMNDKTISQRIENLKKENNNENIEIKIIDIEDLIEIDKKPREQKVENYIVKQMRMNDEKFSFHCCLFNTSSSASFAFGRQYCDICRKTTHKIDDVSIFNKHIQQKDCVSFDHSTGHLNRIEKKRYGSRILYDGGTPIF